MHIDQDQDVSSTHPPVFFFFKFCSRRSLATYTVACSRPTGQSTPIKPRVFPFFSVLCKVWYKWHEQYVLTQWYTALHGQVRVRVRVCVCARETKNTPHTTTKSNQWKLATSPLATVGIIYRLYYIKILSCVFTRTADRLVMSFMHYPWGHFEVQNNWTVWKMLRWLRFDDEDFSYAYILISNAKIELIKSSFELLLHRRHFCLTEFEES